MSDIRFLFNGTDQTTVNSNGTAAAAITSTPPGFACLATSGGVGADMRLATSVKYARNGTTALKISCVPSVTNIIRLPFDVPSRKVGYAIYHGADTLPPAGIVFLRIQDATDVGLRLIVDSNGALQLQDATGANVGSPTVSGAWAANRRNRIEILADNSGGTAAGTATIHVYNDDGTTPTGTISVTGRNFSAANFVATDLGSPTSSTITWTQWFEDTQMGSNRTTEFGPFVPTSAPTSTNSQAPAAIVTEVGTPSTPDTSVTYAITQTSGPAATPLLISPGKWAIPRDASAAMVFSIVTTGQPSGQASAPRSVTVLPTSVSTGSDEVLVRNSANTAWV